MRKTVVFICMALGILLSSCSSYDDSGLREQLKDHEARILKLEQLCTEFQQNISSLQTAVAALEKNDVVTGVTPILYGQETIGYTITFKNSGSINIYNGKDGSTPEISIKQDSDGIWYWILNGEWIKMDYIVPQFKIQDDLWYVSTDNGASWVMVGKATSEGGDPLFKSVVDSDTEVILTLSDGTVITLPKYQPLNILFEYDGAPMVGTVKLPYSIAGEEQDYDIEAFSTSEHWAVSIEKTDQTHGNLIINNDCKEDSKIIVFVTAPSGESTTRVLNLQAGIFTCDRYLPEIDNKAQTVSFSFSTNLSEYEFVIEEESLSWMQLVSKTDSTANFSVTANITGTDRYGSISVISKGYTVRKLGIYQYR